MKNSTFLALGTTLLLALVAGCKSTPLKTTPLPNGTSSVHDAGGGTEGPRRAPSLDTAATPFSNSTGTGTGVAGTSVPSTDLPSEEKLDGRDLDRNTFSAQTVYFDFDRSNVKAGEAGKVEQVITRFKSLPPGHDLLIEGHCDERGTEGYNQALGERRALAIRELVTKSGIDGQHVFTKSFGKDKPVDPGHTETAWSKNRRGEFILVLPKKITTTQNTQ